MRGSAGPIDDGGYERGCSQCTILCGRNFPTLHFPLGDALRSCSDVACTGTAHNPPPHTHTHMHKSGKVSQVTLPPRPAMSSRLLSDVVIPASSMFGAAAPSIEGPVIETDPDNQSIEDPGGSSCRCRYSDSVSSLFHTAPPCSMPSSRLISVSVSPVWLASLCPMPLLWANRASRHLAPLVSVIRVRHWELMTDAVSVPSDPLPRHPLRRCGTNTRSSRTGL